MPDEKTAPGYRDREAGYDENFQANLPRSQDLEGVGLSIVPAYTEAGYFAEANCVTITDGERTAVYVPYKLLSDLEAEKEASNG